MKRLLIFACLILMSDFSMAQIAIKPAASTDAGIPDWARLMYSDNPNFYEVETAYSAYYRTHKFVKTRHTAYYKHWRKYVQPFLDESGFVKIPDANQRESRKLQMQSRTSKTMSTGGPWSFAGPEKHTRIRFNTTDPVDQVSWHANVYCIDQSMSNPDVLFAGGENGGVYKSVNKGLQWEFKSLNEDMTTVSAVAIHPANENEVLVCADEITYRSVDGGDTWLPITTLNNKYIWQFKHHPDNPTVVFAGAENGLYRSVDGGLTFNLIVTGECQSIAVKPGDGSVMYALIHDAVSKIASVHKSIDSGLTYTIKPNGWFTVPAVDAGKITSYGGCIAVTEAEPDRVYVLLVGESQATAQLQLHGQIGVYRSDDSGENWTHPHGQIGAPYNAATHPNMMSFNGDNNTYNQIYYNTTLAVSQLDADRILIGGLSMWRSNNGGTTYQPVGGYVGSVARIHPDNQEFKIYKTSPTTEEFWFANDGGINYSTDFVATHESRCVGIYGSAFWGFDQGWNDDIMVGGRYHNGNAGRRDGYPAGEFISLGGGEAPTGYVNYSNERKTYFSDIDGIVLPDTMNGIAQSFPMNLDPNESYVDNASSRVMFDWDYWNVAYSGRDNKIYKSENGGSAFGEMHAFGTNINDKVYWIEQSRANTDVMFAQQVVANISRLWKSTDRGATWTLATLPQNKRDLNFTLSYNDPNKLWISFPKGANGAKVYQSNDGGASWTNITTPTLDGLEIETMVHQYGTDGGVYLGTYHGPVFYRNATMPDWDEFGTGLPYISYPLRMVPFYRDNKLRLATWHLGIWENELYEPSALVADFSSNFEAFYCPGDTLKFVPHSVASAGATYQWSFPGGSPASSTQMFPATTYSAAGSYDITLIVTDGANSDTITKAAFITNIASGTIPFAEGFESGTIAADWKLKGQPSNPSYWNVIGGVGGYGTSNYTLEYNNYYYDAQGAHDALWTAKYDFTNMSQAQLYFDVAYVPYSNTYSDTLEVLVSTDCGATFTSLYLKGGNQLATGPANASAPFVPSASQWRTDTVDVSGYAGFDEVLFSFENIGRYGQVLYVDNINISAQFTGIQEADSKITYALYPNPASSYFIIAVGSGTIPKGTPIFIYSTSGKLISSSSVNATTDKIRISTGTLATGFYFVKIGESVIKVAVRKD
ncbi:MAG: T9SS type A sorting domain-containing protein [Bacteroidetes bacterium]|nr:T9SS type A sorting domain-containing protein [Bacteroidota bacterium]